VAVLEVYLEEFGDSNYRACHLFNDMDAAGQLGRKTGRGVYTY
jgi:3-hydroxybutyryl-CoA dehydrogenase